jgi:hypothetical protein
VIYLAMNRTIRGECRRLLLVPLLKCKPAAANGAQVAATTPSPFFVPIGGGNNNSNNQAAAAGRSVSMMNRTNTWLASTIPKAIYY